MLALLMLNYPMCHRDGYIENRCRGIPKHLKISRSVRLGSADLVWTVNHRNTEMKRTTWVTEPGLQYFLIMIYNLDTIKSMPGASYSQTGWKLVFILEPRDACLFYESRLLLLLFFWDWDDHFVYSVLRGVIFLLTFITVDDASCSSNFI